MHTFDFFCFINAATVQNLYQNRRVKQYYHNLTKSIKKKQYDNVTTKRKYVVT